MMNEMCNSETEYAKSFSEVYEILKLMPNELLEKIPQNFKKFIKQEKSKTYNPIIKEPLEDEKLRDETIIIMGLIYRDFLVSDDERKILQEKDNMELNKYYKERYSADKIFENKQNLGKNCSEENISIIEYKESVLKTIFRKIKEFLKK